MVRWYETSLTRSEILEGRHSKLMDDFETLFLAMQAPGDVAMFASRHVVADEERYYLAVPMDSELFLRKFLERHSARPCARPGLSECSLVVGNAEASLLLQPEIE
jgi:hypothetical protein